MPAATPGPVPDDEFGLREYLSVLRRRRRVLLVVVLVSVVLGGASQFRAKTYSAEALVVLQQEAADEVLSSIGLPYRDPTRVIQTELRVVQSEPVRAAVRSALGSAPPIEATAVGETDVIRISARDADPRRASDIANAYAAAYLTARRAAVVDSLRPVTAEIDRRISLLQAQLDGLDNQIAGAPPEERPATAARVAPERDALIQQRGALREQAQSLELALRHRSGGARLLARAEAPSSPSDPSPIRDLLLALGLGSILAMGAAFGAEQLDDTVRDGSDVEQLLGVPVLGATRWERRWGTRKPPPLAALEEPDGAQAEAYRTLRTSIQFMEVGRRVSTILVTSSSSGEGKTTTACNLAVALAHAGDRVIAISGDLRHPVMDEVFGLEGAQGLSDVLLGRSAISDVLQSIPTVPKLSVLPAGTRPPNPSELLMSTRMTQVLDTLEDLADIIVLDSPPLLAVSDGVILAGHVGMTMLVVRPGQTSRRALRRVGELLAGVGASLSGTVVNGSRGEDSGTYGYGAYVPAPTRWRPWRTTFVTPSTKA